MPETLLDNREDFKLMCWKCKRDDIPKNKEDKGECPDCHVLAIAVYNDPDGCRECRLKRGKWAKIVSEVYSLETTA